MTEAEYIATSNLQRMRDATRILSHILPSDDTRLVEAVKLLDAVRDDLERRVEEMCDNETRRP